MLLVMDSPPLCTHWTTLLSPTGLLEPGIKMREKRETSCCEQRKYRRSVQISHYSHVQYLDVSVETALTYQLGKGPLLDMLRMWSHCGNLIGLCSRKLGQINLSISQPTNQCKNLAVISVTAFYLMWSNHLCYWQLAKMPDEFKHLIFMAFLPRHPPMYNLWYNKLW